MRQSFDGAATFGHGTCRHTAWPLDAQHVPSNHLWLRLWQSTLADVAGMDLSYRTEASLLVDLTNDELRSLIFSLLTQAERCKTVPLICKAFARTLKSTGESYMPP